MCQTFIILLRTGPKNDARLKPVQSAKKVPDPCTKPLLITGLEVQEYSVMK